jgi:hypothetical protein
MAGKTKQADFLIHFMEEGAAEVAACGKRLLNSGDGGDGDNRQVTCLACLRFLREQARLPGRETKPRAATKKASAKSLNKANEAKQLTRMRVSDMLVGSEITCVTHNACNVVTLIFINHDNRRDTKMAIEIESVQEAGAQSLLFRRVE